MSPSPSRKRARSRGARPRGKTPKPTPKPKSTAKKARAARENGKKGGRPRGALSAERHHAEYSSQLAAGAGNEADLLMLMYRTQLELLAKDKAMLERERRQELRALGDRITKLLPLTTVFRAAEAIIREHAAQTDAPAEGPTLVRNDGEQLAEPPLAAGPR